MSHRWALRLLRLALGAVLGLESLALLWAELRAPGHSHAVFFLLLLAVAETAAAVLFLAPRPARAGGMALLACFAAAAAFHLLHGQWAPLGTLAIDAAAVLAVLSGGSAS